MSNPYDDHPGKGFQEVGGYNPPGGTQAAQQRDQRLAEEARQREADHKQWMDASRATSGQNRGSQHQKSGSNSSCWIATAYYGDLYHPKVVILRDFRDDLREQRFIGPVISLLNTFYYAIGKTTFGRWWGASVRTKKHFSAVVSRHLISVLLAMAERAERLKNSSRRE